MTTSDRLAEHLQFVYLEGAWSDVSVRASFRAFHPDEAASHPIPGRHSAWEILLHMDAWHRALARRLGGEQVTLSPSEDWPPSPAPSDSAWKSALTHLDAGFEELLGAVRGLDDDRIHEKLPGSRFSAFTIVLGVGEHDLYHAGQAVLLKQVENSRTQE